MQLKKYANHGEMLPSFYGVAWYDFYQDRAVLLPIPLNVLVRYIRYFYNWIRVGNLKIILDPITAYIQGYTKGMKENLSFISVPHEPSKINNQ